jgi:E3 ubiquitin-protein ligase HERC2
MPLLDLTRTSSEPSLLESVRELIPGPLKDSLIRQALKSTMVKNVEHGPTITLNRLQIKRGKDGFIGPGGSKSVFAQAAKAMASEDRMLRLPTRVWKVTFVGEGFVLRLCWSFLTRSVDDIGGGYSDSISEMCEELSTFALPILIQSPNGVDHSGLNQDCLIFNPQCTEPQHVQVCSWVAVLNVMCAVVPVPGQAHRHCHSHG